MYGKMGPDLWWLKFYSERKIHEALRITHNFSLGQRIPIWSIKRNYEPVFNFQ